jgi:hypothetical protein
LILKLHPLTENDLKIALDYYYKISPTLEKKFLAQVDRHFNTIVNTPNLYQYETKTCQKAVMKKISFLWDGLCKP